jgi:3',5'-cyclic-AMP phosphodiesterase
MRFVHITDTHIAPDPEFAHYGHQTLANLEALVDAVNALSFGVDFVLHTGDVVEDRSEAAYRVAGRCLQRLRVPIYYVAGNHDDADALQRVLMGVAPAGRRFDYGLTVDGVRIAVFDSRGPRDPRGTLTDEQLAALKDLCTPEGPPLVISLHHPPMPLGSAWLDGGWKTPEGLMPDMLLDRGPEFLEAISAARDRIRGVFFGHVHRAYQVMHRGVLFCSAPSSFGQLFTWPDQKHPTAAPHEPAGFSLVMVTADETVVSQHAIARPKADGTGT